MIRPAAAVLTLIASVSLIPEAAIAADAANGEVLAKRWCAPCHGIGRDGPSATPDVPSFAAIGRKPDLDVTRLAIFLMAPHPVMPDMALTRNEAADLAAYIRMQGR